jgi:hypothetical protein
MVEPIPAAIAGCRPSLLSFSFSILNVVAPPLDITPEAIKVVTTILDDEKILVIATTHVDQKIW